MADGRVVGWTAITVLAFASPVLAGTPTDLVKAFYARAGAELDPAARKEFVDPALSVLNSRDALAATGAGDCLDPNMALDGADFDKSAIETSFKSLETINGDTARVTVAFVVAGEAHRLEWKLTKVGDDWKVADILSVTGEWALSQYQCQ